MNTQSNKAFNSSGAADDSVGGTYQDYGAGGPSAGYENNVQRTGGGEGKEGGVKGLMNKITERMNPRKGPTKERLEQKSAVRNAARNPDDGLGREQQGSANLNRE